EQLVTIGGEQLDGGWAEQLVAIQQGALGGVAFGDIEADQAPAGQFAADFGIAEHLAFDDLATDAPVGIPVQQQWLACGFGLGQGRVQFGWAAQGLPGATFGSALAGTEIGKRRVGKEWRSRWSAHYYDKWGR